jgi:hypothetical protein
MVRQNKKAAVHEGGTHCERFPRDSGVAWPTRRWIVFGLAEAAPSDSSFQASCQFWNLPPEDSAPYLDACESGINRKAE